MTDVYDARTWEDIMRDGYPPIYVDDLTRRDRSRRTTAMLKEAGLYGDCIVYRG